MCLLSTVFQLIEVDKCLQSFKYRAIILSGQYRLPLPTAVLIRVWEAAESATFYMISQSTRSDKRFWSDKIMSPYNDPIFHDACCLQKISLPYTRVQYYTNAQAGSSRKVSGFYSGSDLESRLEHILSCMKFLVLYLGPSRQIPDSASQ